MRLISISTDRKMFEEGSTVRQRMVEYGKLFEKIDVIIFSNRSQNLESRIQISENVFVYPTNSRNKLFYITDAFNVAKKIFGISRNGVVVSCQDPFETGLVGLLLKLFYKLPLQIQIHTDFVNRYFIFHSPLNFLRFPIGLFVLSFADSARVVSQRISDSIKSLAHNVSVLPVFVSALRPEGVNKPQNKTLTLLTVSRLEKEKDIGTAIRAFKKVLEKMDVEDPEQSRRTKFIIVGDGKERGALELLTKNLKLQDKVEFIGWRNDVDRYYADADVYISSSLYEGYGMSVMEAAFNLLPLVLSNTGVAGNVFKDGESALICSQKKVNQFADSIFDLVSDSDLRKKMGYRAYESAIASVVLWDDYLAKFKQSVVDAVQFFNSGHGIFKKNILLRYLVAGLTGATTQIGLLYVFTDIVGLWYLYSSVFSFLAAIIVSFLLQKFWTFADTKTDKMHHQFGKYLVVAILGLSVNTLVMFLLVDLLSIWYIMAQIIAGAIIAMMNFLLYKFFIFHKN